jgi:hypothetical protein
MQIRIRDQESFWRGIRDGKIGIRDKYPGSATLVSIRSICIQQDAEMWGTWIKQKWKCIYSFSKWRIGFSHNIWLYALPVFMKNIYLKKTTNLSLQVVSFFYFVIFWTLFLLLAGPDPLDPWYRYICWVEQSYPKGGKEGNVHVLLEKCIKTFKVRCCAPVHEILLHVANKPFYGTICE